MTAATNVVYYVTSHGYGHMNRAAAVIAALPSSVRVVVKTSRDLFDRFRGALVRPIELVEGVFDSGCVHPRGESSLVDRTATLEASCRVRAASLARLDREVTFLQQGGFSAVVSDIASFPLRASRLAGVPGILVANFTWYDIFRSYARTNSPGWAEMLREMQREYEDATLILRAQPAMASESSVPVKDVGLVSRRGRPRRGELCRSLGLPRGARLVYFYTGRYGQADMEWQNLRRLNQFQFVSYHDVPERIPHWHVVDPNTWSPRDLAASVDVMFAKAGYGTVTDSMVHRTPLIFPPRHGFAEHRTLASGLRRWGGGIAIGTRQFKTLKVGPAIERALASRPGPAPWSTDGAIRCVREIMRLAKR